MQYPVVLKILGILLIIFSTTLLPPLAVSHWFGDRSGMPFAISFVATLGTGLALWLATAKVRRDLRFRDGFMVVVLFWTVLATFGAIPFYLSSTPALSLTDAFFESMSGLTTTGATVIVGLDDLPISIRYYRQQLQWLGGMGIIVLAVAIMPMLGVGGMQLYRAETPGPMKDSKLTPRITETAKALWYIYLGLTVVCALSYRVAGMGWFDAIGHSFSTVAIGGFSTHDLSLGFFNNGLIDTVAILFMLIAGINFSLHFVAWRRRSINVYMRDPEAMVFLGILLVAVVLALATLHGYGLFEGWDLARQGVFQVVSVVTTTGFTTGGYHWWPSFLPLMLLMLSCIGGCAGSTAGGIKVIRIILLYKQGRREMAKLVHPNALVSIKLSGKPVPDNVINAIWAFFSLYVLSFALLGLALAATGQDLVTALSAVAACLNNLGPGLGGVADNYAGLADSAKWVLSGAMLLGRLELFTLLVLFTATFWRS